MMHAMLTAAPNRLARADNLEPLGMSADFDPGVSSGPYVLPLRIPEITNNVSSEDKRRLLTVRA